MDKIQAMSTFVAVVEAGSFVKAMSVLGISKAAVSRHVAELEQHLETRLLQRTTRRLSLCLLYTSPSPRDLSTSRMPSSA